MPEKGQNNSESSTPKTQMDAITSTQAPPTRTRDELMRQGVRYLIVGFSSLALELLVFALLFEALGVYVIVSNVLSITLASTYNFYMSRTWTFKSSSNLIRSIVLYLILFAWNQFFSSWAILTLMDMGCIALLAKAITMAAIVCWNFVLYRKVVFV